MCKDDILLKLNEEFHNRFAMQECDVMFYFNRSEAIQVIDIIFTNDNIVKDHAHVFELQRKIRKHDWSSQLQYIVVYTQLKGGTHAGTSPCN